MVWKLFPVPDIGGKWERRFGTVRASLIQNPKSGPLAFDWRDVRSLTERQRQLNRE
jgi:hypothetical protein